MRKCFIFVCILALVGCGKTQPVNPGNFVTSNLGAGVTAVDITHYVGGESAQWRASEEELEELKAWAAGLQFQPVEFEKGTPPGDGDDAEVYDFILTGDSDSAFSYVINGKDCCYLLVDGIRYSVLNPSNPPVSCDRMISAGSAAWTLDRPPELVVSTLNQTNSVTASCGNYHWSKPMPDGTMSSVIACGMHPLDEVAGIGDRGTLYTAFPAGTLSPLLGSSDIGGFLPTLYLDFGVIPPDTVTARRWPSAYQ